MDWELVRREWTREKIGASGAQFWPILDIRDRMCMGMLNNEQLSRPESCSIGLRSPKLGNGGSRNNHSIYYH